MIHVLALSVPSWTDFSQYVFSGLSAGCAYALVALGFVVIANVTGVFNFAQGDYVMVGAMFVATTHASGWNYGLSIPLAIVLVAGIAVAQERVTVAPIRNRVGVLGLVVASLGAGIVIRGIALGVWGKDVKSSPSFEPGTFTILGAHLDNQSIWVWSTTIGVLVLVVGLFQFTAIGRAMRACAINATAARLLGIRVGTMSMAAFALGGALSGLIGAITVPLTGSAWDRGLGIGLVGFIAAALAEFNKPGRAVLAGLFLGVIESLGAGVISSPYREAILYSVLLVYLFGKDLFGDEGVIDRLAHARVSAAARRRSRVRQLSTTIATAAEGRAGRPAPLRWPMLIPIAALGLAACTPFVLSGNVQAMDTSIYIVLSAIGATGLCLVMGLGGQLSLGQAGFYLLGGYTVSILTAKDHWDPLPALAVALGLSVAGGAVIGWLTLRLRGFNLALATLALHLIALVVVTQYVSLTGGPLGVIGVPPLHFYSLDLTAPRRFFWTAFVVLALCLLVARNIWYSRIGRSLRAIAADEEGAQSLALNAFRLKVTIFIVGSAMAGVAGGLWAFYIQYAAPASWDFSLMISLITYVIVGGIGSVYGGAVGALVVGLIQHVIRHSLPASVSGGSNQYEIILFGALIIFFILVFPDGLIGGLRPDRLKAKVEWLRRRPPLEPVSEVEAPPETAIAAPASETVAASREPSARPEAR